MPQPLIELGGPSSAPILHFAVANGFVLESYLPLLRPLMADYRVLSCPMRALWGDQSPPVWDATQDWTQVADEMCAAWMHYGLSDLILVGHSMGGVASALATIAQPERVRALILLDPTFLPPVIVQMLGVLRQAGTPFEHPLAQGALRRKRDFDSPQSAYERWRTSRLFADWDDEALRLYAEQGTVPKPEGGVTLRFTPEWEAYYFSTGWLRTWDDLHLLDGLVPTLIVRGGTSDTYTEESAQLAQARLPSATHWTLEGHGHLFPQSAPRQTAQRIGEWLKDRL